MTAKPQQTDQSNAADDLIAELARLMAQDAGTEKPPEPPAFALRIPGEPTAPAPTSSIPAPRFDFGAADPQRAAQPAASVEQGASASRPTAAEPFTMDAGAQHKVQLAEVPAAEDAIAQLIEAEFANAHAEPQQVAAAETVAPEPVAPLAAERAPERPADPVHDQFRIPPVFGLGGVPKAPASAAPDVDRPQRVQAPVASPVQPAMDPINEIESLIGRVVQVGLEQPAGQQQEQPVDPVVDFVPAPPPESEARSAAGPISRSLATPTLKPPPQPAAAGSLTAADETIMAAAQATGAQLEWVDQPEVDEPAAQRRERSRPRLRLAFSRAVAGPAVALTLLLAAGFGLYWVLGLGTPEGPAPLLTASAEPVKEVPEVPAETSAPQQSVVFNEMAGGSPEQEQLVSRDQADVTEVAATTTLPGAVDSSANRKVRTVTVRPDGTIVSGEDGLAGGTILPVARPNVPDVPGATDASPLLASTSAASSAAAPEGAAEVPALPAEAEAAIAETAATPPVPPVEPGTYVAAVDVAGNPIPGKTAPVPMLKPQFSTAVLAAAAQAALPQAPTSASALVAPEQQASLPPPPSATPAPAPAAGEAPAYIQLSSQRTEEAARASAQEIVNRFGPLFGGGNLEVQRVDLGERGIFYRVRAPAASLSAANSVCTNIKAAGGDCFTM